jgi:hypothetical protein
MSDITYPFRACAGLQGCMNETNCARVVSVQPIREDGSGGDVTLVTECVSYRSITLRPVP